MTSHNDDDLVVNSPLPVTCCCCYEGIPMKDLPCRKQEWKKERIVASVTCFSLCGKVDILKNSLYLILLVEK